MSMRIEHPGIFTLIQDIGRWGHQAEGVSVSQPMDPFSFRMGNAMLGNDDNAAALEVLLIGLTVVFDSPRCIAATGADLGLTINGAPAAPWRVHRVEPGDRAAFKAMGESGCRAYLCVSGGIDVPPVMGSRSTYVKGKLGGLEGRPLKAGDVLPLGVPAADWQHTRDFICPEALRTGKRANEPLFTMDGPQIDAFSEKGIATLYNETYTVSREVDRMGYRLSGPEVERVKSADIVSDGIVAGSVQVPGNDLPIVMMADCQTTGGYTKIAVVSAWSIAQLAQKLPGETVRFQRVSEKEAADFLVSFEHTLRTLRDMRAAHRTK